MNAKFNILFTSCSMIIWLMTTGCKGGAGNSEVISDTHNTVPDTSGRVDSLGNGKTYKMIIESKPDLVEAGKQVVFVLTPQIPGKETEPVPLNKRGGFEIDLIMVSNDLSWFDHRHPVLADLGTYEQNYTFSKGGLYNLYVDYQPTGSIEMYELKSIGVNGNSLKQKKYSDPVLTSVAGPFEVSISPGQDSTFESGTMQTINTKITKGETLFGLNDLGDYLGSKGYMVIISVKEKDYLRVQPVLENGNLDFHTVFPLPGFYRAWLQFQTENIVQTADFVIQVVESEHSSETLTN